MKPNEQNLERLLKKLIKQERVSASDLLLHWDGLGITGDRVLISTLNKQNGWEPFLLWAESEPRVVEKLKSISDRPGISEAGLLALKSSGSIDTEGETPRSESLWILQTMRAGESDEWGRATGLMMQNEDFFFSTLALLELEESPQTTRFFTRLLDQSLTRQQDQATRRSLYRLRQKGIEPPVQQTTTIVVSEPARPEIFLLAHNRLPLWQPFFYYRSTGSRGDWFFAEISEGKLFEIIQQQRDIRMSQKRMQEIADNYAVEFEKGTGVNMPFVAVNPEHARFYLQRSFQSVSGAEDFQKYLGNAPVEDPNSGRFDSTNILPGDVSMLLEHEHFRLWTLEDDLVEPLFKQLQEVDEGPIVLPEHQTRQRKAEITQEHLKQYFTDKKRSIWRNALDRAAYFLRDSDPDTARQAFIFASLFQPAEDGDVMQNNFAQILLERSLQIRMRRMEQEQKEQKRSSLIMTPQEFERSMNQKK